METNAHLSTVMLRPVMTKGQEFEQAEAIVKQIAFFTELDSLERFAMAKHLENIAKAVRESLSQDALALTTKLIDNRVHDDKGEPIVVNKQFTHRGNDWCYIIKEEYTQLGDQFLSDGTRDPNSVTFRTCELSQSKLKEQTKALTAQMAGLRTRILTDHPLLKPTDISVSLTLKEAKNG